MINTKNIKVKQHLYNGSTWGYGVNMVTISVGTVYDPSLSEIKEFLKEVQGIIRDRSYPDTVYSQYDCTGSLFGSRWERVCYSITDVSITVTYLHHYSMDI